MFPHLLLIWGCISGNGEMAFLIPLIENRFQAVIKAQGGNKVLIGIFWGLIIPEFFPQKKEKHKTLIKIIYYNLYEVLS